ncbi:ABC transporter, permease protein (cluster 9, phospholipid), partial [Pseudomonas sp. FG-3G]
GAYDPWHSGWQCPTGSLSLPGAAMDQRGLDTGSLHAAQAFERLAARPVRRQHPDRPQWLGCPRHRWRLVAGGTAGRRAAGQDRRAPRLHVVVRRSGTVADGLLLADRLLRAGQRADGECRDPVVDTHRSSRGQGLARYPAIAGLCRLDPRNAGPGPVSPETLAHYPDGCSHRTDGAGRGPYRRPADFSGGRGGGVSRGDGAGRFRRQYFYRGLGGVLVSARIRRVADCDSYGRSHRQRLHRPDRLDEGQRRNRRDSYPGPRSHRVAGGAASAGPVGGAADADLCGHALGHCRRRCGVCPVAGYFSGDVPDAVAVGHRRPAFRGGNGQGADLCLPDCCGGMPGRLQSQRQRRVCRGSHHLERGAVDFCGDRARCGSRAVFHGDAMV